MGRGTQEDLVADFFRGIQDVTKKLSPCAGKPLKN